MKLSCTPWVVISSVSRLHVHQSGSLPPQRILSGDMPGLLRKFVIIAAVDGLILQPHGNGGRNSGNYEPQSVRIDYKTNKISPLPAPASDPAVRKEAGLEAYGLVGKLASSATVSDIVFSLCNSEYTKLLPPWQKLSWAPAAN